MLLVTLPLAAAAALGLGIKLLRRQVSYLPNEELDSWFHGDAETRSRLIASQEKRCLGAPFIQPADGFIGLLYGDPRGPYTRSSPHQGIDIFSEGGPGTTPVYAAYDGYLTRESGWRSSLIIRVPEDPLGHGRQIWLYYTHMADREGTDFIEERFPPGTREQFVRKGALLGYTGNFNGDPARPVAVHLHFSLVLDNGRGGYRNELEFDNTIDPSPYLGKAVRFACEGGGECTGSWSCDEEVS